MTQAYVTSYESVQERVGARVKNQICKHGGREIMKVGTAMRRKQNYMSTGRGPKIEPSSWDVVLGSPGTSKS